MEVKIRKEPIQADVLIIGGGVAGMQAAIAAGEKGEHSSFRLQCLRHRPLYVLHS